MVNIASAIRNTVPISLFNRGLAGKIFNEVKQSGAKVVMKHNAAECAARCSRRAPTTAAISILR